MTDMAVGHQEPHFDADGYCMCGKGCCVSFGEGRCLRRGCRDKTWPPAPNNRNGYKGPYGTAPAQPIADQVMHGPPPPPPFGFRPPAPPTPPGPAQDPSSGL